MKKLIQERRGFSSSGLMGLLLLLAICCAFLSQKPKAVTAVSSDIEVRAGRFRALVKGLEYLSLDIRRKSSASRIELKIARMEPRRFRPKVVYGRLLGLPPSSVRVLARKSRVPVMVNGGFFDEKDRPLGLLIIDGKVVQKPYPPSFRNSGVFSLRGDEVAITLGSEFSSRGVTQALSCTPRLIASGKFTQGVRSLNTIARRSGVAIDRQGRTLVFATDSLIEGLSFDELRGILRSAPLSCVDALCLDGGGSTQLFIEAGGFECSVTGLDPVPVGLGFSPAGTR